MRAAASALLLALAAAACGPLPERAAIPTVWYPSPNHDQRRPSFVVIHHTGSASVARALANLTDPRLQVSAHYVVSRDGTIYQLVDERARAWHAGESNWGGNYDVNSSSIGIELDNSGDEPFPDSQIGALLALLADLRERYRIPAPNFLGHADVAPRRKVDPSRHFPWRLLAQHGFGLWCDKAEAAPPGFDPVGALAALGYDMADPGAAIRAFKLRYAPSDPAPELSERDRGLLFCLLWRKREAELRR